MKYFNKLAIFIIFITIFIMSIQVQAVAEMQDSGISYIEDSRSIENPDRGFYSTMPILCTPTATPVKNPKGNLIHLRIGVGAFSKAENNVADVDFTKDMLDSLNATLGNIRKNGGTAIIRFAYDNFQGISDREPSIEQIVRHIEQLEPLFEKNKDVITCIESGFLGQYGEQHSSKIITNENFKKMLDALLQATPETMTINVRTPKIYANYIGIPVEQLAEYIPQKGTNGYRIGIFNDGYLGSETDLGTYPNREECISWLKKQAMHTIFGGEVVANYSSNGYVYNSPEHIEKEMYLTHTTYLNKEWNDSVIRAWKEAPYTGTDQIYLGKTAYEYIDNHLGYRFVLRESKLTEKVEQGESLRLQCKIENVGAGNVVNPKETTLLLVGKNTYSQKLQIDPSKWNSKEITKVDIQYFIDETILAGDYKIYLKLATPGQELTDIKRTIQFANASIWEESLGANYLGEVTISEKRKEDMTNEVENEVTNNAITNSVTNTTNEVNNSSNTSPSKNEVNNHTNASTDGSGKDNTIAEKVLPKAGKEASAIPTIIFMISFLFIFYMYMRVKNVGKDNADKR